MCRESSVTVTKDTLFGVLVTHVLLTSVCVLPCYCLVRLEVRGLSRVTMAAWSIYTRSLACYLDRKYVFLGRGAYSPRMSISTGGSACINTESQPELAMPVHRQCRCYMTNKSMATVYLSMHFFRYTVAFIVNRRRSILSSTQFKFKPELVPHLCIRSLRPRRLPQSCRQVFGIERY